jgi:hypothetical protein
MALNETGILDTLTCGGISNKSVVPVYEEYIYTLLNDLYKYFISFFRNDSRESKGKPLVKRTSILSDFIWGNRKYLYVKFYPVPHLLN